MANVMTKSETTNGPATPDGSQSSAMVLGSDAYRGALEPTTTKDAYILAETMASIGFCGVTSPAEALGRIMTGRGIGLSAMQSMRGVYTINGRPGLDASLMHALCLASPLCEKFSFVPEESDETKATFVAKRRGDEPVKHVYTLEQARGMGVLDRNNDDPKKKEKDVWQTHRSAMLRARCKAELARLVFPDLTFGMYSREEMEAGLADEPGNRSRDPNEIAAEILSAEEAEAERAMGKVTTIQSAKRDFAAEAEALKMQMRAATTRAENQAVREAFSKWDAPEDEKAKLAKFYEDLRAERAAAKAAAEKPAVVGEGNLFAGDKDASK